MEIKPPRSGSKLMNYINGVSGDKDLNNTLVIPATPTGFNVYDLYSGFIIQNTSNYPVLNGGIFPRLCNIIGESATGKSSKAIKDVSGAIDRIWKKYGSGYSEMYFLDPEEHTSVQRILNLSNWSPAEFTNKCNFRQSAISLVDLANLILRIYDTKIKYRNEFILPSGLRDVYGKEVMFLAPTFIILDSVAAVNPNGLDNLIEHDKMGDIKELSNLGTNMEGAQDVRAWTIFVRKIKPFLDAGYINLTCINHKSKEMIIDPYAKKTRYLPFLDVGEKLKGGQEIIYQSYQIFYILGGKKIDEKDPIYGPAIDGLVVNTYFPKNKANIEGAHFPMVFNKATGYHPELSDFEYLFQTRYGLQGTTKFAFDVLPEVQFTRKNLLDVIEEYPAVSRALAFTARIAASFAMQYYQAPPSLSDFSNIPLEQRLSILYAYTESYGKHQDYSEIVHYDQCEKIAIENRHYVFVNHGINMGNVLPNSIDLHTVQRGYTIPGGSYVDPYNMDEYTDGFFSYPPGSIKDINSLQNKE
jgi:hypothetical protein